MNRNTQPTPQTAVAMRFHGLPPPAVKNWTNRFGPKYTVAVIYAPPGKEFICFEPMSAITDAFNLAQRGIYKELQSIPARGTWRESFWIQARGF